ncbi:MAG: protein-glutamate O-methyltransferase CheR [Terracidiphilus sp.]|jgi:chemotaxis protein methyltransferase CheR
MGLREFKMFRALIHQHTGIWLRDGKQIMLASRLSRRLRHHGIANFAEYYEYVQRSQNNSEEMRELINCVTTNKTSFFRERHHFEFLAGTVVPRIQFGAQQGAARSIRIWSAACSTGEEPYSIAITLFEALRTSQRVKVPSPALQGIRRPGLPGITVAPGSWKIEIVASDIDTKVLGTAARGVYSMDSLASVETTLQKKYFLRGKDEMRGQVKVKPEIAGIVDFKRINLQDARWPLEGLFDVIFFRNALIYFNQETQDVFLRKMACYLKPKGYLFLGNSEHIPWLQDILAPLNQTMYQLRDAEQ